MEEYLKGKSDEELIHWKRYYLEEIQLIESEIKRRGIDG